VKRQIFAATGSILEKADYRAGVAPRSFYHEQAILDYLASLI